MKLTDEITCAEQPPWRVAGHRVRRFTLKNSHGMCVELMEYGATLLSVLLPDETGAGVRVDRGLSTPADYEHNIAQMGATCGRYAGRIGHGRFTLQGNPVTLTRNDGAHHLHGGQSGFSTQLWQADPLPRDPRQGVSFRYHSPAGEEGYPGGLQSRVRYALDAACCLHIVYEASVTESPTVVNLTNHCYWNLSTRPDVLDHELWLAGRQILEFDAQQIPNGERIPVSGSPFDFSTPSRLGAKLAQLAPLSPGLDHCYVDAVSSTHNRDGLLTVARLHDPASRRTMTVHTDQPALVVYSGNHLDGSDEVGGHRRHAAICLECQQFPDAPNHPDFPDTTLQPGELYRQHTVYEFS